MCRTCEIDKIGQSFYSLPMWGVLASIGITLVGFIRKVPWSFEIIVWNCTPLLINLLFLLVYFICKKERCKHEIKKRRLTVAVLFLIVLNISLCVSTSVKQINIGLKDLNKISESKSQYNVLFGSNSCIYCKYMDEIYKKAFVDSGIKEYYYINLTYEGQNEDILLEKNIEEIPVIVQYVDGQEKKRLSGTSNVEEVIHFLCD